MSKKLLLKLILILFLFLLLLLLVNFWIYKKIVKAPLDIKKDFLEKGEGLKDGFQGPPPGQVPYVKGPKGPPPGY